MDLWQVARIVLRRWYVVVPVLAVAVVVAIQQPVRMESEYEASATFILVVPNNAGPEDQSVTTNAFLSFSGSLGTTAEALTHILNSEPVRTDLQSHGLLFDYQVSVQRGGPILRVTAVGPRPDTVIGTVEALRERARSELGELQDAVRAPSSLRITAQDLSVPLTATEHQGSVSRLFVAIVGLGTAAAVSLALLTEAAVAGVRRLRRTRSRAVDGGTTASRPSDLVDRHTILGSSPEDAEYVDSAGGVRITVRPDVK